MFNSETIDKFNDLMAVKHGTVRHQCIPEMLFRFPLFCPFHRIMTQIN